MTKSKLMMVATVFAVAMGICGAKVFTAPPAAEAAVAVSLPVEQITQNAAKELPEFDAQYRRHLGVLDTL